MTTTTTTHANAGNYANALQNQRYEFILYINDHIICQRYFNIPDFNEASVSSNELNQLMKNIVGMNNGSIGELGIIPNYLKTKSIDYLWDNYKPYLPQTEEPNKNIWEKIDNFQFEIKIDKLTVAKSGFSGNFFQPKVRYAVDVREIIPEIMAEIRNYLSQKKYRKVVA